jgi:hypothetical protein
LLGAALLLSHGTPEPCLKKSSLQGKPGLLLLTGSQEEAKRRTFILVQVACLAANSCEEPKELINNGLKILNEK